MDFCVACGQVYETDPTITDPQPHDCGKEEKEVDGQKICVLCDQNFRHRFRVRVSDLWTSININVEGLQWSTGHFEVPVFKMYIKCTSYIYTHI